LIIIFTSKISRKLIDFAGWFGWLKLHKRNFFISFQLKKKNIFKESKVTLIRTKSTIILFA
jgi:hypothetical protein